MDDRHGMTAFLPLALLLWAAFGGPVAPGVDDVEDEAREAEVELAKADAHIAKGRYSRAIGLYKKLARKWPATPAGREAARRLVPNDLIGWADVLRHGPSANRVDIVLTGDGFELDEQDTFDNLAEGAAKILDDDPVFEEYFEYLNFIRANAVSEESGVDQHGRDYSTAWGGKVSPGAEQYQVTVDRVKVRTALERLPEQDGLAIVFVKGGSLGTGGGGVAAVGAREPKTMIHEWGHAFGRLKDEYSTRTGYRGDPAHAINVSNTPVPEHVPWAHWIEAKVPGIGVYEGADGRVRGAWKPTSAGCRMGDGDRFCRVCREALVLAIYDLVDPIDGCRVVAPEGGDPARRALAGEGPFALEVSVMRPAGHNLEVRWWIFPEATAPPVAGSPALERPVPRRTRGPLPAIDAKPAQLSKHNRKGVHVFRIDPKDLEPGFYRVVCRARDTTRMRGDKWPWVLKDTAGLLESERSWRLLVD